MKNQQIIAPWTSWSITLVLVALLIPILHPGASHAGESQTQPAQTQPAQAQPAKAEQAAAPAPPTPSGFLADFMALQDTFSGKIISLAKTIPADKYSWRPAEGVRSIGEAVKHIARTNFGAVQSMGVTLPPGLPTDYSQVTEKDQIVALLEMSFKMAAGVGQGMASVDLTQPVPNGGGMTMQGALLGFAEHHGEHLGQLIAYSRTVGVVPPWSR